MPIREVTVYWIDAQIELDDLPLEGAMDLHPLERQNRGYLIKDTDGEVVVAFGIIHNPDKSIAAYDKVLVIPKRMVKRIEEVK